LQDHGIEEQEGQMFPRDKPTKETANLLVQLQGQDPLPRPLGLLGGANHDFRFVAGGRGGVVVVVLVA